MTAISQPQKWLWTLLAIAFFVGLAGACSGDLIPVTWVHPAVRELSAALLTASILAFTVDRLLKIEIAKDVFQAAFRYVLPDELKEEVKRIIDYHLLAFDTRILIRIKHHKPGLVKVEMSIEKALKNISRHTQKVSNTAGVDEWGFECSPSKVEKCVMKIDDSNIIQGEPCPTDSPMTVLKTREHALGPGQAVTFVSQWYEIYRDNGAAEVNLLVPHVRPKVTIQTETGIMYDFDFGVPGAKKTRSSIDDTYTLEGTHFPGQRMRVRWWLTAGAGEPGSRWD